MKSVLSILLITIFAMPMTLGQLPDFIPENLHNSSFFEITAEMDDYYLSLDWNNPDRQRYKKWRYSSEHLLDENGHFMDPADPRLKTDKALDGFTTARSGAACWEPIAPKSVVRGSFPDAGKGRANCIAVDPDDPSVIYLGTAAGLWKSTNAGGEFYDDESMPGNWVPLLDEYLPAIGVSSIIIDPTVGDVNNRTIYVLTGDGNGWNNRSKGVHVSTDSGVTWNPTNYQVRIDGYKMIAASNDINHMLIASSHGMIRTTDGWNSTADTNLPLTRYTDVEFKPGDPNTVYACSKTAFYISDDGGANFTPLPTCAFDVDPFSTDFSRVEIAVSASEPEQVYVLFGGNDDPAGSFHGLYSISNPEAGCSSLLQFELTASTPNLLGANGNDFGSEAFSEMAIEVNPENGNEIHVGGIRSWRSLDGGVTWLQTSGDPVAGWNNGFDMNGIHNYFYGSQGTLYCANDMGIHKTEDHDSVADIQSGAVNIGWKTISYGLQISEIHNIGASKNPIEDGIGFGTYENGTYVARTDNALWNRNEKIAGDKGFQVHYDPSNEDRIFSSSEKGEVRYHNISTGETVTITPIPTDVLTPGDQSSFYTHFAVDKQGRVVIGFKDVYRWENGVWTNLSQGSTGLYYVNDLVLAPGNSDYIYILKNGELKVSKNAGLTWEDKVLPSFCRGIQVHPTDPEILWMLSWTSSRVYRSNDAGQSWVDISPDFVMEAPTCITYQNGSKNGIYVGTTSGVFYTDDNLQSSGGPTWVSFNDGLPMPQLFDIEINYCTDMIYAGCFGRGLWESPLYADSYSSDLTLNGTTTESQLHLSDSYINSTESIAEDHRIVYFAGNTIRLQTGFFVDCTENSGNPTLQNTMFCAEITGDPCESLLPLNNKSVELLDNIQSFATTSEEPESNAALSGPEASKELISLFTDPTLQINGNLASGSASCRLNYELQEAQTISILLLDMEGRIVQVIESSGLQDAGSFRTDLRVDHLADGMYLVALYYQGGVSVKKLLKQN